MMFLCGADLLESFLVPGLWMEQDMEYLLSHGITCLQRAPAEPEKLVFDNELLYRHRVCNSGDSLFDTCSRNPSTSFAVQRTITFLPHSSGLSQPHTPIFAFFQMKESNPKFLCSESSQSSGDCCEEDCR